MQENKKHTITEVSKTLNVSPDTLRRWEKNGVVKPTRDSQNKRLYSLNDLAKLKTYIEKTSPKFYSIQQAAKELRVSPGSIRRWEREGKIKTTRTPGGHRRFSHNDLQSIKKSIYSQKPITPPKPSPIPTSHTTPPALSTPQPLPTGTTPPTVTVIEQTKTNIDSSSSSTGEITPTPLNTQYSTINTNSIAPPTTSQPSRPVTEPEETKPKRSQAWAYTTVFAILLFILGGWIILYRALNTFTDTRSQATNTQDSIYINQDTTTDTTTATDKQNQDIGSFLGGRITIGSDTGDLSNLDQHGNINLVGDVNVGIALSVSVVAFTASTSSAT